MGDAGLLLPSIAESDLVRSSSVGHETTPPREVTVLVTGFGPFKSFTTNPSWLIASSLPAILQPQALSPKAASNSQTPIPNYVIRLIVHPSPVRVAYATASTLIPNLIQSHDPDYVVHIGMAGGRDHYTLETIAHRDNYKMKDVDDRDGWREGEHLWKKEEIPDYLRIGWEESDVLSRWERELDAVEDALGLIDDTPPGTPNILSALNARRKKSVVRLSRDAGRYLCEFVFMQSLSKKYLEARRHEQDGKPYDVTDTREGKVAFLHVPGGYATDDIARGMRVAEAAIRSLVASWEEGFRRKEGQQATTGVVGGRWEGVIWRA